MSGIADWYNDLSFRMHENAWRNENQENVQITSVFTTHKEDIKDDRT